MDTQRFDRITSSLAERSTRRVALRTLAAAAFGVGSLAILGRDRIGSGHLQDGAAMLCQASLEQVFRILFSNSESPSREDWLTRAVVPYKKPLAPPCRPVVRAMLSGRNAARPDRAATTRS